MGNNKTRGANWRADRRRAGHVEPCGVTSGPSGDCGGPAVYTAFSTTATAEKSRPRARSHVRARRHCTIYLRRDRRLSIVFTVSIDVSFRLKLAGHYFSLFYCLGVVSRVFCKGRGATPCGGHLGGILSAACRRRVCLGTYLVPPGAAMRRVCR
ncbi:hypothetical protein GQ53DRAFT_102604 [Thozetella sp. PMI_491]|nr:hypothetical protein GQ53DRAFT_102604 [Thozetella sp. PMI_491]